MARGERIPNGGRGALTMVPYELDEATMKWTPLPRPVGVDGKPGDYPRGIKANRWRGLVRVADIDGTKYPVRCFGNTKSAAERATQRAADDKLAALARGRDEAVKAEQLADLGDTTTTIGDLIDQVMSSPDFRDHLAPGTIGNYRTAAKTIQVDAIGALLPRELDPAGVRSFLERCADGHGRSAKHAKTMLSRAMDRANEAQAMMVPFNPVGMVKRAVPNRIVRPSSIDHTRTPDEATVDAMLAALRDDPHFGLMVNARHKSAHGKPGTAEPNPIDVADIMAFMYRTGTRVGEASAIRWSDLDLGELPKVEITGSCRFISKATAAAAGLSHHGTVRIDKTKTKKGDRLVPLRPALAVQLAERADAMGVDLSDPADLALPVFPSRQKWEKFRDAGDLRRAIQEAQVQHGIDYAATHVARKAFITRLNDHGVPTSKIADAVGHVRIEQTLSYIGRGRQMDPDVRAAL